MLKMFNDDIAFIRGFCLHLWFQTRDTHTRRQATQHGCLPSLLGDGGQMNLNIVWWKKFLSTVPAEQSSQGRTKYLVPARQAQQATRKGPFSFVLFESPFTPVSKSQQGPPLSSLSVPDGPTTISVNMMIRSIDKIDDVKMEYSVQITFR